MLKIIDKLGKLVGILKDDATEPEMKKTIMQIVCKDCQFHPCVCEKDKENK